MTNPTWGSYIVRRAGALCVANAPAACIAPGCHDGYRIGRDGARCPACSGTGLAWHLPVQPAAGWLVARLDGTWDVTDRWYDQLGAAWYEIGPGDDDVIHVSECTPLAPPANTAGCTVSELLGLLDGAVIGQCELHVPLGEWFFARYCGEQLTFERYHPDAHTLDPDAVILAATNFKALQAWAGAK